MWAQNPFLRDSFAKKNRGKCKFVQTGDLPISRICRIFAHSFLAIATLPFARSCPLADSQESSTVNRFLWDLALSTPSPGLLTTPPPHASWARGNPVGGLGGVFSSSSWGRFGARRLLFTSCPIIHRFEFNFESFATQFSIPDTCFFFYHLGLWIFSAYSKYVLEYLITRTWLPCL